MSVTQMKRWIDSASYEALMSHWRHAAPGDAYLTGSVGEYFKEALKTKRKKSAHQGRNGHITSYASA